MRLLEQLFENNRAWARRVTERDPAFFRELSLQQSPQYLWIGCADSRVPANEIVDLRPGELFVHRNVANVVVHSDLNCLSVIQFALEVLNVKHVIVCGHYGCGGVNFALHDRRVGLADNWLRHVQDVKHAHETELTGIEDPNARHDRLCELNVIEQVVSTCRTTVVRDAWDRGQPVAVHGWIYRLDDGLLRDLSICVNSPDELAAARDAAVAATAAARARA